MKKTHSIAGTQYLLPFRARGLWVEDARGTSICECINYVLAKALAELLNGAAHVS